MARLIILTILSLAAALGACSRKPGAPQADNASTAQSESTTSSASTASSASAATAASPADGGARIYGGNCVACHQPSGLGIPGVYPSLAASPVVLGDPAQLALWVIRGQRPPSMPQNRYPTQMLQFGWMKPADAAALFSYLRSNFGNSAPPVEAATVAKALGE